MLKADWHTGNSCEVNSIYMPDSFFYHQHIQKEKVKFVGAHPQSRSLVLRHIQCQLIWINEDNVLPNPVWIDNSHSYLPFTAFNFSGVKGRRASRLSRKRLQVFPYTDLSFKISEPQTLTAKFLTKRECFGCRWSACHWSRLMLATPPIVTWNEKNKHV